MKISNYDICIKRDLNTTFFIDEEITCCLDKNRVMISSMFLVFVLKAESEKQLMRRLEECYIGCE